MRKRWGIAVRDIILDLLYGRCKECQRVFVAARYPYSRAKQPEGVNMPVRWAWGTAHPTICQDCAGKHDFRAFCQEVADHINSGGRGFDRETTYSAGAGRFI